MLECCVKTLPPSKSNETCYKPIEGKLIAFNYEQTRYCIAVNISDIDMNKLEKYRILIKNK